VFFEQRRQLPSVGIAQFESTYGKGDDDALLGEAAVKGFDEQVDNGHLMARGGQREKNAKGDARVGEGAIAYAHLGLGRGVLEVLVQHFSSGLGGDALDVL